MKYLLQVLWCLIPVSILVFYPKIDRIQSGVQDSYYGFPFVHTAYYSDMEWPTKSYLHLGFDIGIGLLIGVLAWYFLLFLNRMKK